jgi:hydroxyquinol 1,2-dioxygenase
VLARLAAAPSPRIREISAALVRHLHAFVREVRPTEAEWAAGIDFLTRTGQMCSDTRQEFILLSDALGVSMLVDAINHPRTDGTTETTILGPFYVKNPPEQPLGSDISGGEPGRPLLVEGTVRGRNGDVLPNAWVDTWHANADGFYDVQSEASSPELNMRARFRTDAQGRFWFRTVVPSFYPIPDDGPVGQMLAAQGRHPYRPAHIHFIVGAPAIKRSSRTCSSPATRTSIRTWSLGSSIR